MKRIIDVNRLNNLKVSSIDVETIRQKGMMLIDSTPVGSIMPYAGSIAPNGWLLCDGSSHSRTEYGDLFSVLQTTYGSLNTSSFNVPDMRGRTIIGVGTGPGLTTRPLGVKDGEERHTLTLNEMPSHSHTGTTSSNGSHSHTATDSGHTHTQTTINDDFNSSGGNPPGFVGDSSGSRTWSNINTGYANITVSTNGAHTHTMTTDTQGSGQSHNVMQPFIALNYIIKSKSNIYMNA
jgi:microcystin-dependent protein